MQNLGVEMIIRRATCVQDKLRATALLREQSGDRERGINKVTVLETLGQQARTLVLGMFTLQRSYLLFEKRSCKGENIVFT